MNVNIVCETTNNSGILMRLAKTLAAETGWSLSPRPVAGRGFNLFMCYIEHAQKYSDWHNTPVAVWFTHLEAGSGYKEFWWDLAAATCDLRLTSARQYADNLQRYGPTGLVTPPVDREHFNIRATIAKANDVPRVGVAGWATAGPRKGAKPVAMLAGSKLGHKTDLVGSGVGWPVPTKERDWDEMPDYYNGLDVYLCPSLTEGIPMPPLEALACGTKIVIPEGVGLLDDIPDTKGVYRYAKGNYDTMEQAVKQAIAAGGVDREALRAASAPYTKEAWAKTWAKTLDDYRKNGGHRVIQRESDRHGKRGVYYVAYGPPARGCCKAAITSFQKFMPGIEVALASDKALGAEDHLFTLPDEDIGGRAAKVQIYDVVPNDWEYILYLDADTEVIADISFLYQLLEDGFDMVICKNPDKYHVARKMVRTDNADECNLTFKQIGTDEVLQLNGGVFAFQRNERTKAFFRCWHEEWQRYGKRDQAALLRSLWKHPLKMYVLGNEWNTIVRYANAESSAGILHYPMTARRWRGQIVGRSDSDEAWKAVAKFKGGK